MPRFQRSLLASAGLICTLLSICHLPAQQSPDESPSQPSSVPTIRAVSRLVLLDVVATDGHGHAVAGLKQSDFNVLEDDQPQRISSFSERSPVNSIAAANLLDADKLPANRFTDYSATTDQGAWTVLLIDALYTSLRDQMYVHQQLVHYMKSVPAGAKIAIFRLDSTLHLVQGFTDDPKILLAAAQDGNRDKVVLSPLSGPYYRSREELHREAMRTIGHYLADFPGRKNLIWFTGSIPYERLFDLRFSNPFPESWSFEDDEQTTKDVLTLSRVALYPIDTGGVGATSVATQSYLDDLAAATGGKAFYSTNNLADAIAEIRETGSHFYTLGYSPTNLQWDGTPRKLRIELTDPLTHPGVTLEYRRTYYSKDDSDRIEKHLAHKAAGARQIAKSAQLASHANSILTSMQLGTVAPADIVFFADITRGAATHKLKSGTSLDSDQFLRPDYRKQPYRNFLIRYSADTHDLSFTRSPDGGYHATIEYIATVFTDNGLVANALQSVTHLDLSAAEYAHVQRDWIGVPITIAVPAKGTYYLRLGVYDPAANRSGIVEVPVAQIQPGPSANGIAVP